MAFLIERGLIDDFAFEDLAGGGAENEGLDPRAMNHRLAERVREFVTQEQRDRSYLEP